MKKKEILKLLDDEEYGLKKGIEYQIAPLYNEYLCNVSIDVIEGQNDKVDGK